MARFLFIHGAWQAGWCWRWVLRPLIEQGHETAAIDLPGHGEDSSPVEELTLDDYVDRTIDAVNASPEKPILVGHSGMGPAISQTAERIPDRIRALIYVAALMPPRGSSMMSLAGAFDPAYLAEFIWAPDRRTVRISPEGVRRFLYSSCPSEVIEAALPLLTAEPVAPFETPLSWTEENCGRVPRYYIECLRDRIVPIALQRAMREQVPCVGVYTMDTDHCPYFSAPEGLAKILQRIAEEI